MKKFPYRWLALVMTLPIFLGAGCAWQSDLEALQREVSKVSADSAMSSKRALDTATAASQTSERAANAARQATELSQKAVAAAEAANMRVARMLEKPAVYTLTFGFNKARVNFETGRMLDEILTDWKGKAAAFRIVGYADMVGSKKYNRLLSQMRANAVRNALVRRGVSPMKISALGVGQQQLAVPTKHGRRLRENRRVVLTILPKKG